MVTTVKQKFPPLPDGTVDLSAWLNHFSRYRHLKDSGLIQRAARFTHSSSQGLTTFYGQSCLEQGLEMADLLLSMQLDAETAAAAIVTGTARQTQLPTETLSETLGTPVAHLVQSVLQMDVLDNLGVEGHVQIDRLRKTFLAMAGDIRAVLIRLAERTCIMHGIKHINPAERARIAQKTMDIYAPLANRLGIGQLKWELEDTAFHFMHPSVYHDIATFLAEKRVTRENHISRNISLLRTALEQAGISATVYGRVKHIYSIYLKAQRKQTDYSHIFDCSAVRILVDTVEECYAALSVAHSLFRQIPEEFDDYISRPKPNGYRSIHTAVNDHEGKTLEIQIRTHTMHDEAEHGVAAHWMYKESGDVSAGQEARIRFLRQLLAWQRDVARENPASGMQITEDTVYVFTPAGEIIDLPKGATPLDFAYRIHTSLGHRCRGAKIGGHIVQLTRALQTGDHVEIITVAKGGPSRDWLSRHAGYLTTARARAKVAHWLRQQDPASMPAKPITEKKIGVPRPVKKPPTPPPTETEKTPAVADIHDFLTRIARCCNPGRHDAIAGYITLGRGISIHRINCNNILAAAQRGSKRIIPVSWEGDKNQKEQH